MKIPPVVLRSYRAGEAIGAAALKADLEPKEVAKIFRVIRERDRHAQEVAAEECCMDLRQVAVTRSRATANRIWHYLNTGYYIEAKELIDRLPREYYTESPVTSDILCASVDDRAGMLQFRAEKAKETVRKRRAAYRSRPLGAAGKLYDHQVKSAKRSLKARLRKDSSDGLNS